MKTGKITAKLRDTVPICLMVEGYTIGRDGTLTGAENKALVEALDRPIFKLAAALLHEMVHFYNIRRHILNIQNHIGKQYTPTKDLDTNLISPPAPLLPTFLPHNVAIHPV